MLQKYIKCCPFYISHIDPAIQRAQYKSLQDGIIHTNLNTIYEAIISSVLETLSSTHIPSDIHAVSHSNNHTVLKPNIRTFHHANPNTIVSAHLITFLKAYIHPFFFTLTLHSTLTFALVRALRLASAVHLALPHCIRLLVSCGPSTRCQSYSIARIWTNR